MASVYIAPELNFFSPSPIGGSFTNNFDETLVSRTPVEFGSTLEFISYPYNRKCKSMCDISLSVSLQVVKKDGTAYSATDTFQPRLLNSIVTSLFKTAKVYLNNVLVFSCDDLFHLKSYIENSLNYSAKNLSGQYANSGHYPVESIKNLESLSSNSKIFDCCARLPLVNSPILLIPNVEMVIRLEWNPQSLVIVEKATDTKNTKFTESKLIVKDVKMYVKHFVLQEHIERSIDLQLRTQPAIYESKVPKLTFINIMENTRTAHFPQLFVGNHPEFLAVVMLENKTFVGLPQGDVLKFKNFKISQMNFVINNKPIPENPYTFKFSETENVFSKALSDLYAAINLRNLNKSCAVSVNNFKDD